MSYHYGGTGRADASRKPAGDGVDTAASQSEAITRINLTVDRGERLGIVGPNGGGKSTLLSLITGMRSVQSGNVRVLGESPERARDRGMIGYVAQRSEADRRFPISVQQVVEMPLRVRTPAWCRLSAADRDRAQHALELVDLRAMREQPVDAMSGGQFQRLLIARAVVTQPEILVLDEPTVGIDVAGQQRFADLIDRLVSELGLTILIVSHDLRAIAAGCDRVACLARTLHYHDSPVGLTPAVLAEVFHHDLVGVFGHDHSHDDVHNHTGCAHSDTEHAEDDEHNEQNPGTTESAS